MSRHRNVKQMIADDDYYDDYDDYDDDYDDYDTPSYSKPKASSNQKKGNSKQKQAPQKKTTTPQKIPAKSTTAAAAAASKAAPVAAPAAVGVAKPPPGWGKPAPTTAGVSKPPPGWGKPSSSESPASGLPSTTTTATADSPSSKSKPAISSKVRIPPVLQDSCSGKESQLSMVVIGHVDAGKSTMMGQLLYQVGQISKRDAIKVTKNGISDAKTSKSNSKNNDSNNIQWAWLLDENEGERAHGVTMQIATKTLSTPHHPQVIVLDAPGHADFVPTMITGAANADAGLLVVDASGGEASFDAAFHSGKGQTKEHILLARGLGVSQLVVCINKLDVRDWSQTDYERIQQRLLPFLTQHAHFAPKRIRFVPTSGLTGANIKDSGDSLPASLRQWYQGPTLFEAIDSFQAVKHSSLGTYYIVLYCTRIVSRNDTT